MPRTHLPALLATAVTGAVLTFAAGQAVATGPAEPAQAARAARLPTWNEIKDLKVADAVRRFPPGLQEKATGNPLYALYKNTKVNRLPKPLQAMIQRELAARSQRP